MKISDGGALLLLIGLGGALFLVGIAKLVTLVQGWRNSTKEN